MNFLHNLWTCNRKNDKVFVSEQILTKIVNKPNLNILLNISYF